MDEWMKIYIAESRRRCRRSQTNKKQNRRISISSWCRWWWWCTSECMHLRIYVYILYILWCGRTNFCAKFFIVVVTNFHVLSWAYLTSRLLLLFLSLTKLLLILIQNTVFVLFYFRFFWENYSFGAIRSTSHAHKHIHTLIIYFQLDIAFCHTHIFSYQK